MGFAAISVSDGEWDVWADQWVAYDKLNRVNVRIPNPPSVGATVGAFATAIGAAGAGGTLVVNVGHGYLPQTQGGSGSANAFEGAVDMAPAAQMLLVGMNSIDARAYVSVFYDTPAPYHYHGRNLPDDRDLVTGCRTGKLTGADCRQDLVRAAQTRLDRWRIYEGIGSSIRAGNIYKVILLTCRIGQASEFLRKMASDWGVILEAYTRRVALERSARPYRVYLDGDAPTAAGAVNIPPPTDANSIRVGPPL